MQFAAGYNYQNDSYFYGVCSAIKKLHYNIYNNNIDFIISCGDNCPPDSVLWTIDQVFDPVVTWYPCMGNHEMESFAFQDQINHIIMKLPDINVGFKPSVYSFDRGLVHFSVLDVYQKNNDADIYDELLDWLEHDLLTTMQSIKIVIGHEPAFVLADQDCGRLQYVDKCLDEHPINRDRFWQLLRDNQVTAYLCGHTHNYSAKLIDGVWQINLGHSRGKMETGAPSTFLIVDVLEHSAEGMAQSVMVTVYRDVHDGEYDYDDIIHVFDIGNNAIDLTPPHVPTNFKIAPKMP